MTPRLGVGFSIVGVGASAGGLDALRGFLDAMANDSGMAFVIIQHLSPTHESFLPPLLRSHTGMTIHVAAEGMVVEPNHVYVNPPGVFMTVSQRVLHLTTPPDGHNARLPIDHFLRSLALDQGHQAVCVILSGTGLDGSQGALAVSQQGGLVVAQLPTEASYDGMPQSAIATGAVHVVLALKDMPAALMAHAGRWRFDQGVAAPDSPRISLRRAVEVAEAVRRVTGHDFREYKPGTLTRRIERRMGLTNMGDVDAYLELVTHNSAEAEQLVKDLLISVTAFFRDPGAWQALADKVIAGLVNRHRLDRPIRAWVAGCSTGEEAYSIAMVLMEQVLLSNRRIGIQVFATDIDQAALQVGRAGLYPRTIAETVSAERLERFFVPQGDLYRVKKDLRDCVIFAPHNLINDPPISHMDLMVCRNVLIYLRPEVQQRVLAMFRFTLNDGGALFLGASESLGVAGELFAPIDKQAQLYRPVSLPRPVPHARPFGTIPRAAPTGGGGTVLVDPRRAGPDEIARNAMLEAFAPATVLINRHGDALYFHGPVDRYLTVGRGKASLGLAAMARPGLSDKLRFAIARVARRRERLVFNGVALRRGRRSVQVSIELRPLAREEDGLCLVSFSDEAAEIVERATANKTDAAGATLVAQLERELKSVQEELQATIQDLEATNQEMRSTNEQTLSLNEEMQATNEELEASQEELQSMNEELTTLNVELRQSLERQGTISDDLQNVLTSSDVATLFLDTQLNIRFFTPAIERLFNIQQADVGRPIGDFTRTFTDPELADQARRVLREQSPVRAEVLADSGLWFHRRLLPYRTADGRVDGVVITFADITDLKHAEQRINAALVSAENVINSVRQPLLILDDHAIVQSVNRAFHRFFATSPAMVTGRRLRDLGRGAFDLPDLNAAIERLLQAGEPVEDFRIEFVSDAGEPRILLLDARDVWKGSLDARRILVVIEEVRTSLRDSQELRSARDAAEASNEAKSRFLMAVSHDLRQPMQTMLLLHGVLAEQKLDELSREVTNDLGAALDEMNDTLDALLDVNQLQTGAIHPVIVDFPIQRLFDRIRSEFRQSARAKQLALRIVDTSAVVRTDQRLFERIVQNLMSNALKYTNEGKILLGCRRRGDDVRIEVWDTGIGIPRDKLPLIFQENYQVTAMAGPYRGRGLGLSIALRFAELLGHKLDVCSRLGHGSMFSVEVPSGAQAVADSWADHAANRVPDPPGPPGPPDPPDPPPTRRRTRAPGSARVLVLEDDQGVRGAVVMLLEAAGFAVEAFATAEAVLATAPFGRIGCLLVDNGLPGMSGIELIETLRSRGDATPAIIFTALADDQLRLRATRAGVDEVVSRPLVGDALVGSVRRSVAGATRHDGA